MLLQETFSYNIKLCQSVDPWHCNYFNSDFLVISEFVQIKVGDPIVLYLCTFKSVSTTHKCISGVKLLFSSWLWLCLKDLNNCCLVLSGYVLRSPYQGSFVERCIKCCFGSYLLIVYANQITLDIWLTLLSFLWFFN